MANPIFDRMERLRQKNREKDAEINKLKKAVAEAERIKSEAHVRGDHYAYDLMRTVLAALEDCAKPCETCEGTGRKPTTLQGSTTTQWHSVHCPACNGTGIEP